MTRNERKKKKIEEKIMLENCSQSRKLVKRAYLRSRQTRRRREKQNKKLAARIWAPKRDQHPRRRTGTKIETNSQENRPAGTPINNK